jgi:hypothetical protein
LTGQEAPASLQNTGKPITVPFLCSEDDMHWAGLSCSEEEPCPVYFELAAAEPVGNRIFAVGNLHSETVTLYSILLGSEDEGQTWREVSPRMRGTGLDHIQFTDLLNGWISGESLFPLPQDPFLLSTIDGGNTWRRQAVTEEGEPGSVQQFFFLSKERGSLIIDRGEGSGRERYALHETSDGGHTWSVKRSSKTPIPLPRSVETAADWRVQPDRATQSFRIERRQAGKWTAAASFAVKAGVCRPAAAQEKAAPEDVPEASPAPKPAPGRPGRRPH